MSDEIGYNKKQNEYFNRILDLLMDETIISGSELKFPFLSQGTKSKDLYNQFFPHPKKYTHFINNPISSNLTTLSYKIGEYMKEVYGVTDEEVGFLWDLYRERVKSKLNKFLEKQLPPSVFNTIIADLWERTVKIPRTDKPLCTGGSLEDYDYWCTRCNQTHKQQKGGDQEGPYDRANLVVQLHLPSSEFPYNVETGRGRSWGQLNDYLTGQYGLTPEECQKVWDRYRTTICKNPQLPTLNESRDKQQELIQYVITTLLKETIIDKENSEVILPWNMKYVNIMANFAGIDKDLHNAALELNGSMAYNFWDMMESIYGLTDDEVERVWKIYGPTLSQRMHDAWFDDWKTRYYGETILDEAEAKIITHPEDDEDPYSFAWHPEPKKRKFYEAVLRDVVKSSRIEIDGVISVGDPETAHQRGLLFHNLSHSYDVRPFLDYLKDTYGLLTAETHPIWSRWEHIMVDKIKKWLTDKGIKLNDAGYEEPLWAQNDDQEEINESKDKKKVKQQKVLDYAIEDLTNNTLVDWGYNEYHNDGNSYQIIRFPFSVYPHEDPTKNRLEWIMIDPHYNLDIAQFYTQFKPYARMMYGLTDVELLKIFADWEGEIIEKIRDHSETDPPRA